MIYVPRVDLILPLPALRSVALSRYRSVVLPQCHSIASSLHRSVAPLPWTRLAPYRSAVPPLRLSIAPSLRCRGGDLLRAAPLQGPECTERKLRGTQSLNREADPEDTIWLIVQPGNASKFPTTFNYQLPMAQPSLRGSEPAMRALVVGCTIMACPPPNS